MSLNCLPICTFKKNYTWYISHKRYSYRLNKTCCLASWSILGAVFVLYLAPILGVACLLPTRLVSATFSFSYKLLARRPSKPETINFKPMHCTIAKNNKNRDVKFKMHRMSRLVDFLRVIVKAFMPSRLRNSVNVYPSHSESYFVRTVLCRRLLTARTVIGENLFSFSRASAACFLGPRIRFGIPTDIIFRFFRSDSLKLVLPQRVSFCFLVYRVQNVFIETRHTPRFVI